MSQIEIKDKCILPTWVDKNSAYLADLMMKTSKGLTDKVNTVDHEYQYLYFPYLSALVREKFCSYERRNEILAFHTPKIRMLEIGLGCSPEGGMINGLPGGSALAWRSLFENQTDDFELHILEFDDVCALKWSENHKEVAIVHVGDASSEDDLRKLVTASSINGDSTPFDIIVDDGSHINDHQIKTFEMLIPFLRPGGFYVIEDIHSSCRNWVANIGTRTTSNTPKVGGTRKCMHTNDGSPTIFAKIVEWQKNLILRKETFKGVNHIDFHKEAVLFGKIV